MRARTRGLGDRIASIAKALGLRQTPGCGCARRQAALNRVSLSGSLLDILRSIVRALSGARRPRPTMTDHEAVALAGWKRLAETARDAGMTALAEHAEKHAALIEAKESSK